MVGRLAALAVALPVAILATAWLPLMAPVAALLLPAASIGWALRGTLTMWALAMGPALLVVSLTTPQGVGAFVASVVCGPVVARFLRAGDGLGRALAAGAVPLALWSAALAVSGVQPFPEDSAEAFEAVWRDANVPPDRLADLRASSETALEVLQSTWVASEVVWFWVTLVAAWWFLGRLDLRREPELGPLSRFDLPDLWVGVVIAGMAAVLLGRQVGLPAVAVVGWNLVFGAAFVFAVRGVAVQTFWMQRAGWRRPVRVAVLGIGFLLALPVFVIMGAGLGLFDAWFDFRRIRGAQSGE